MTSSTASSMQPTSLGSRNVTSTPRAAAVLGRGAADAEAQGDGIVTGGG